MARPWNAEIPGWLKGYGTGIFPLGISTRPKISSEIVVYFTKLINAVKISKHNLSNIREELPMKLRVQI
jgi:hypothetical protein